ncbi:hypothetical protein ACK4RD_13170 [Proteus mirabilis]|uniref:hypothetical protein n=1 Tax=Proteus mirabilis TaxID=584 RepID=UPI00137768DE|nr:hypothetical protein [Proteus mirabilis]EKU0762683.1 hypothetical protein [Proteus mirabilis]EKX9206056.1 hypothetical protein [Proteus mirabilis]MBG5995903.1 hypothetical protein [Proteus mirabilis]NBC74499.1 hypothetical protein [Proteus mirabilis]
MKKRKIHIYSDINYHSYQHINQMLYRQLSTSNKFYTIFLQRFIMNSVRWKYVLKFFSATIDKIKNPHNKNKNKNKNNLLNVKNIVNIPPQNLFFDFLNTLLVKFQLLKLESNDIVITFVPSKGLDKVFSSYNDLIYYCVHDSNHQSYHARNKKYEKLLVKRSSLTFCDNEIVLNRLAEGSKYINILEKEALFRQDSKFYLVPPPVPNEFYNIAKRNKKFDLVYFGSIHKDININLILNLSIKYSILIISYQNFKILPLHNITFVSGTPNIEILVKKISLAKAILFPYVNSEFMNSISPAKLYQSIATSMPIYCSNKNLCEKYNLNPVEDIGNDTLIPKNIIHRNINIEDFREKNILSKIELIIRKNLGER